MFASDGSSTGAAPADVDDTAPATDDGDSTDGGAAESSGASEPPPMPGDSGGPEPDNTTGGPEESSDDGGSSEEGSSGGEVSEGFGACAGADEATCNVTPQCLWNIFGKDVGNGGSCNANPQYCTSLDELACGGQEGCAWQAKLDFGEGCTPSCVDLAQASCDALSFCEWFPGEGGAGLCFGG